MRPNQNSQWLFPPSALEATPSQTTSDFTLEKELYDRARGVEFLFRLGSSLALPPSAMFSAATWFHRFYMRHSMEDYHRQDVAASCIFLATKTEECGRKLRDVARVCLAKSTGIDVRTISPESAEVDHCLRAILLTEEALLEALCFDFVIESPHAELVDLFDSQNEDTILQDYAWSIAHDSYRTPLCVLYTPQIIAAACYIMAQKVVEGSHSPSLDSRTSFPAPAASLPTPPSHKPSSPDASRFATGHFSLSQPEIAYVADAMSILLEFYGAQTTVPYLSLLTEITPPTSSTRSKFYYPPQTASAGTLVHQFAQGGTPSSSHGGSTPVKSAWIPVRSEEQVTEKKIVERLDLS